MSSLHDTCPHCEYGGAEIFPPLSVASGVNDSLRAAYRCTPEGHSWVTWWDRQAAGWPQDGAA